MNRKTSFHVARRLSLPLCLMFAGCGGASDTPDLGYVEGTVTLDGQPLEGARVAFQPDEGRPSSGETDGEGAYVLMYTTEEEGARIGTHKVTITTYQEPRPDSDDPADHQGTPERVPAQYNHNTTLTADVVAGDNPPINFPLESGGEVLQPEDVEEEGAQRDAGGC